MATLMQMNRVAVAEVDASARLRPISEAGVESLIASITETGVMKDAIHVRKRKDGQLQLIAGGHRLEAARRLGWAEIEAKVWTNVTDDWVRLLEIDDNLAGAEMNALDTAVFLAERKAVYERLHPEARRGFTGGKARHGQLTDMMSVSSFAAATAEKFSLTERHVRRMIAAGSNLSAADVENLRGAKRPVTLKDLTELAKIGEAEERSSVVLRLATGNAKSAAEARRTLRLEREGEAPVKDPVDVQYLALMNAYRRASKAAKRRFVNEVGAELRDLLADDTIKGIAAE